MKKGKNTSSLEQKHRQQRHNLLLSQLFTDHSSSLISCSIKQVVGPDTSQISSKCQSCDSTIVLSCLYYGSVSLLWKRTAPPPFFWPRMTFVCSESFSSLSTESESLFLQDHAPAAPGYASLPLSRLRWHFQFAGRQRGRIRASGASLNLNSAA